MYQLAVLFTIFLAVPLSLLANLRMTWDGYEIWMVREEIVAPDKKKAFEKGFKEEMRERKSSKLFWPEYIVEGIDTPNFIHFYPLKSYASLDAYFEDGIQKSKLDQDLSGVQSTINTIFKKFPEGAYIPEESYKDWLKTPFLHYWVISLKYGEDEPFEYHMKQLVSAHSKKKTPLCFRTWKVTFGADLPKYVVVLFAKEEQELDEHLEQFDLMTPSVRSVTNRVKEGQGEIRPDLMKL